MQLSDDVKRGSSPALNKWSMFLNRQITGDKDLEKFNFQNNVFATEFAKVVSGNPTGVLHDAARQEMLEKLSTAANPEAYKELIKLAIRDMQNRSVELENTRNGIRSDINRIGSVVPPKERANALAVSKKGDRKTVKGVTYEYSGTGWRPINATGK